MSVYASQTRLTRAAKDLKADWQRLSFVWNDSVSRAFAEKLFPEIETEVRRAVSAMSEMNQIIDRVKRDCGER